MVYSVLATCVARSCSGSLSLHADVPSNLEEGIVWYFLCPETGKRCGKLYLQGTRFLHREAAKGAMGQRILERADANPLFKCKVVECGVREH